MSFISGLSRNPLQGFTWEDIQRGGYSHPTEMSLAGADPLANFEAPKLPARRGGFFGSGGVGRNIVGSIGDFLLQQAGGQPIYAPQMEMQRRLQLHQMQREQENEDWMNRQNYEAKMRPPANNDTAQDFALFTRLYGEEEARNMIRAREMRPVPLDTHNQDGSVERRWIYPPMPGAAGQQGGGGSNVPRISSAEEYERLPPGTQYRDPQGNLRTKGGAASQGQAPFGGSGRHQRTAMAESGGRDYASSGQPLTSSAGARYAMQVLPSTAANPGFGIRPAANDSPAEYNRVGREYIDAMTRQFGSEAAGAAAYNYGPGNLRNLMRRQPNDWRNRLPRETRDYLRRQGL